MDYRSGPEREPDLERDGRGSRRLEEGESPQLHHNNSPTDEKPLHEIDDSLSGTSSALSERHKEGLPHARTIRRSSTRGSLDRAPSRRLERVTTRASTMLSADRSRAPRSQFKHPLTHEKTAANVIVDCESKEDPSRRMEWTFKKIAITTLSYGFTAMCATFASGLSSPVLAESADHFSIGTDVPTL